MLEIEGVPIMIIVIRLSQCLLCSPRDGSGEEPKIEVGKTMADVDAEMKGTEWSCHRLNMERNGTNRYFLGVPVYGPARQPDSSFMICICSFVYKRECVL